ncbi:MAG: hemerythrin domain-containing protein [Gammaproteobacteria bacterium]|jgi:hemerythrin-like domain-containing protein|nr:hemerythrin domain-containing protein [Gammaproteobacteria bacterium]MBU0785357.1 hemerythrin domain-containing protein [Gammaproteobacteria bacterium]MBU0815940.1 hemerythrin domain-containing protein [Gammaproteobacteria bacterium]MBU1787479.1 hemerythrin domain-containing protein [Gammaproteobacteria bacterium]
MTHESIRIIRDEHSALAAMLQSLRMMVKRGPGNEPEHFFDVLRAMLFYIDEFPERLHHTKETELLFPPVAARSPHVREVIERLEKDHAHGESTVREIQHLLLAWELIGESRRAEFEETVNRYLDFYLEHMRLEETVVIPEAQKVLTEQDWKALDEAFATNCDPLTGKYPRDPAYDRLFTRIVMQAPAPIGLGEA